MGKERPSLKTDSGHRFAESILAAGGEPTSETKVIYQSQFLLLKATSLLLLFSPNSIVFLVQGSLLWS